MSGRPFPPCCKPGSPAQPTAPSSPASRRRAECGARSRPASSPRRSTRWPPGSSAWAWSPASESPSCRAPGMSGRCSTSPAGPPRWSRSPSTRRARPSRSPTSSPIPRPASSSPRRSPWPSSFARPPSQSDGRARACCPWMPERSAPSPRTAATFRPPCSPSAPSPCGPPRWRQSSTPREPPAPPRARSCPTATSPTCAPMRINGCRRSPWGSIPDSCSSSRWPTCSPASYRSSRSPVRESSAMRPTPRTSCRISPRSARPTCWSCRECSRRSTTPPTPGRPPAALVRCSAGRRRWRWTTPGPWTPRRVRPARCVPDGRWPTASSSGASGPSWAAMRTGSSPAAHPCRSAWPTSTAGSAYPSWRATA